jgi:protoporphyrinogen/coproporphyrinogen III oxidase
MTAAQAPRPRVTVVGGGIAGLAAAYFLRDVAAVTVLEGAPRLGGKLSVSEIAGVAVDEGAEALLARRPEGTGLAAEVGLGSELRPAGPGGAAIWTRGRLRPLPRQQFMGVPADLDELAASGIVSAAGLAAARAGAQQAGAQRAGDRPPGGDEAVASYLGARLGPEVVDRLVDPLLGGVYAGRSEQLSWQATMPALAAVTRDGQPVTEAAAGLLASAAAARGDGPPAPVFVSLPGGLASLVPAVAAASAADLRTGAMVRAIERTAHGWRLTVGSAHDPRHEEADAVVLALPAAPAGRLLSGLPGAAAAAAGLAGVPTASMAIVTLAFPDAAFPAAPSGSGYLVPAVDGHAVKAVTFSSVKWPHLRAAGPGLQIIRCSLGRIGEETLLHRDDSALAELARAELAKATGVRGQPAAARVTRWGGALPQYTVGHLDRVARIRDSVASQPGLAVCGAVYDGVGIPACIASARAAARRIAGYLQDRPPGPAPVGSTRAAGGE